ncbi:MAG: hypothetical protein ACKOQM_02990 [Novosphingobium sp.]
MSLHTIRTSNQVSGFVSRPAMDPSQRLHIYGPLRPLKPRSWIERLLQR